MSLERRNVEKSLVKKGFVKDERTHHTFYIFSLDGSKIRIMTRVSRGSGYKTLGDDLVSEMAKQCRLSNGDFQNLIDCPLSRDAYEAKLKAL